MGFKWLQVGVRRARCVAALANAVEALRKIMRSRVLSRYGLLFDRASRR